MTVPKNGQFYIVALITICGVGIPTLLAEVQGITGNESDYHGYHEVCLFEEKGQEVRDNDSVDSDVCSPADNRFKNNPSHCSIPGLNGIDYLTCGLDEIPNTTENRCREEDALLWVSNFQCPAPMPEPLLGKGLVSVGALSGAYPTSIVALQHGSNFSGQGFENAVEGSRLSQSVLLKDLLAGVICTFILVVGFLTHLDGRRYLQNREIRRRVRELGLHVHFQIVTFFRRVFALFVQRPLMGIYNSPLPHFLIHMLFPVQVFILSPFGLQHLLPCGCPLNNPKRSICVTDTALCNCNPLFLRRSVTVAESDVISEMVIG